MEIINVEQGSIEWLRARLGKVTGTRLGAVMGSKKVQEGLIYELVAEQLTGKPEELFMSNAMVWGKEHEDDAIVMYEKQKKVRADRVGFCISKEFPYLGLSPDRLIGKKTFTKGVEVKAPTTKTVVKYMLEGGIPPEYRWQIVNYFLVCTTMRSLDFVVYDPRIVDPKLQLTIVPIKRSDVKSDIEEAKARLVEFRSQWEEVYKKVKNK